MNDHVATRPPTRQETATLGVPTASPSHRTGGRGRWLVIAVALLLAAVGAAWWSTHRTASVRYVTVPATRGAIVRTVTATGTVNPELTIIVGSYVSGVIQQLFCDYNTRVKAGQICAKIDPRPYQMVVNQEKANLAVAQAQLEKDRANLTYAKLSDERNRALARRQFVSQDAADMAKNAYDQALAQVGLDQAAIELRQAALDAANVNLDYTNIVSPVDGTVVSRNVTQGQTVAASFQTPTLFLIASDLAKMQVDTNISESDIGGVKEGATATFTVDAFPNRVFQGVVLQVRQSPQTVQNIVTFDAVLSVTNHDLALKPGMTAATRVIVDRRSEVIRVPDQALRYTPDGGTATSPGTDGTVRVWVLRDGRPVPLAVETGLDDENFTEIVKGDVRAGDAIIVGETRGASDGGAAPASPHS